MLNQLYTNLKSPPQLLINNIHSREVPTVYFINKLSKKPNKFG